MSILYETDNLVLRELVPTDDQGMFELDSDSAVHRYLGNKPLKTIEESRKIIENVRKQYADLKIGRWAVVEKTTNRFIGWSGLKFCAETRNSHTDYYDLGYRFIPSSWGKGYATESSKPAIMHAFKVLKLPVIYGNALKDNGASRRVLEKLGFSFTGYYSDPSHGDCAWYELKATNQNIL